jgi:hypothetical protein
MDFLVGLPCTLHGYDSIWVTVYCLMKSSHFIPVGTSIGSDSMQSDTFVTPCVIKTLINLISVLIKNQIH